MKKVVAILSSLLFLPIRFYITWYILNSIEATELPMFLFWVSIPVAVIIAILKEIADKSIDEHIYNESTEFKTIKFKEKLDEAIKESSKIGK